MRILYFISPAADFLADSLLHGLRSLYGTSVVDYPRHDVLYTDCPPERLQRLHGKGFSLHRSLPPIDIDRTQIGPRLMAGEFDLVVVSNIWMGFGVLTDWWPELCKTPTAVLDGCDSPQLYPYAGKWLRLPQRWFVPRAHSNFLYFKREWTEETAQSRFLNLLPSSIATRLARLHRVRPISFSIPTEKLFKGPSAKKADFALHMVDPEAASFFGGTLRPPFTSENEYYQNLQESRFGITTKRSGWDCLRHYEIASQGCVPCFRDLEKKPRTCAPHGLDASNSISYRNSDELRKKIAALDATQYENLRTGALRWAAQNTTQVAASRFVDQCQKHFNLSSDAR